MHYANYQEPQDSSKPSAARVGNVPSSFPRDLQSSSQDTDDHAGSHVSDYYLRNQLHNYSFGTAPRLSNSPSTYPTTTQDEAEFEELMARADITPRPSVVAYSYQPLPRTVAWPSPVPETTLVDSPDRRQMTAQERVRDDGRSANESTSSSASASVTSFNDSIYSGSVISRGSSSVPHTPTNEFTSSEDDERSRRSDFSISGPYPSSSANASTTSMEFSSEEEYDSDEGVDFEISSARVASVDMSFQEAYPDYASTTYSQERRGSLPMAIPGSSPSLNYDYSLNARRPSRSLDDDLCMMEATRSCASRVGPDGSSLPSPISVPGSEGDWRNLNARARQRGSITGSFHYYSHNDNEAQSSGDANDVGDFDLDWTNLQRGIVSLDKSELRDIVRQPGVTGQSRPPMGPRWFPRFGGSSNQTSDYSRRPSIATVSSAGGDTFGKAAVRWGGEDYQMQLQDWSFKREKIGSDMQHAQATSGNTTARGIAGFLVPKSSEDERKRTHKDREKEKERVAKAIASWRGMQIDSQEIWKMDIIGRFKVERKATKTADIAKGPQQRIVVHRIREPDNSLLHSAGPTSTIHKHSKAVAFSIGRYYRKRTDSKEKIGGLGGGLLITASHPPAPPPDSQKRHSSMVLLAPRRVQIAFTNTTSTRKLESHGLLDEDGPQKSMRELDPIWRDGEREKRDKGKGKGRERQEREKYSSGRGQEAGTSEGSERTLAPMPSPIPSGASASRVNNGSTNASVLASSITVVVSTSSIPSTSSLKADSYASSSNVTSLASSGRSVTPISTNSSMDRRRPRRKRVHDPLELDEEEDDYVEDGRYSPPTRTPHSETYGTVDASLIEQLNLERAQLELETGSVFRRLFRGRNGRTTVPTTGHLEANYVPPWIVLPSRSKQEQQQRVVENLNSSFMDVGLLPSTHRIRKHSGLTSKKKRDEQTNDILSEVPEESLYMLLPLWPGETDPLSAQRHLHLLKRIPPTDRRQYLLIYYQAMDSRKKGGKKKRPLPTTDYERNDRTILLTSFHISARFVAHNELIGTGIRVPEEGLTISGPLDYAWETLPSAEVREAKSDWVIGICNSRESGIEFLPDGLVKMDLCRMSWKPPSAVNDKYIPPEPTFKLTPVGQAVVEMAWLGAIALTSFGQVGLMV